MIRPAHIEDAEPIHNLISFHAQTGLMLYRTLEDVRAQIEDFLVCEIENIVLGASALSFSYGTDRMVEIRSLAVHPLFYRQGVATALVEESIRRATLAGFEKIFVLTYALPLFLKQGFEVINKMELPQKIWKDCQGCLKQARCDEVALIRDLVPAVRPQTPEAPAAQPAASA